MTDSTVQPPHHHHHHRHGDPAVDTVSDPVCGMSIDPATAKYRHTHRGRTYYFCGAKCRDKFQAEPDKYLASRAVPTAATVAPGTR